MKTYIHYNNPKADICVEDWLDYQKLEKSYQIPLNILLSIHQNDIVYFKTKDGIKTGIIDDVCLFLNKVVCHVPVISTKRVYTTAMHDLFFFEYGKTWSFNKEDLS